MSGEKRRFDSAAYLTRRVLAVFAAVMLLTGCGVGKTLSAPDSLKPEAQGSEQSDPSGAKSQRGTADLGGEAPVQADVTQAFFVGGDLHVTIQLLAKTEIAAAKLIVRLLGLETGTIRKVQEQRASEIVGEDTLEAGESLLFRLKVPAENLTEYQIQVAWGAEADIASPKPQPGPQPSHGGEASAGTGSSDDGEAGAGEVGGDSGSPESGNGAEAVVSGRSSADGVKSLIGFRATELEETGGRCGAPPCDKQYAIRAEIENASEERLSNVRLAVGIYFSVPGMVPSWKRNLEPLADGEEVIDLGGTVLEPGALKKIKVDVDRKVPVVTGGAFLPYVRVLDYKPSVNSGLGGEAAGR